MTYLDTALHADHQTLGTHRAPVLLALVVMGKVGLNDVQHVRHLSDDLDALYDEAEERAYAERAHIEALMRNDLAHAQIRQRRRL